MGGTVGIFGTNHNTAESITEVRSLIRDRQPDVVALELPPELADGGVTWSIRDALDPRHQATLPGLAYQRFMLDGEFWDVEEMFTAAATARDVGASVALIDRPFSESADRFARGLAGDLFDRGQSLRQEVHLHRSKLDDDDLGALIDRDFWAVGKIASPVLEYTRRLREHGANPLAAHERAAAAKRMSADDASAFIDVMRAVLPRVVATHIDQRDAHMAGHIHWLAAEEDDIVGVMAKGHVPGVTARLNGQQALDVSQIEPPTYVDPADLLSDYHCDCIQTNATS